MLSTNQIAEFLNFDILNIIIWSYKVDFFQAGTYLLKLQIDDVILGGRGQSCLGLPKKAIKT